MSLAALAAATLAVAAPTPEAPVVVDGKPISRGALRHWAGIAARASGVPEPRIGASERRQAAALLIGRRWILDEARERGIHVARGKVRAEYRVQVRQTFPRRSDYLAFLRETGQKPRHIRSRLAMDILSTRIRRQVLDGIDDPQARQDAFDAYVVEFRRKWRSRTACLAPWVTEDCGQDQARSSTATMRSA